MHPHQASTPALARAALLLAVAAIAVNAPRLILVFLEAEAVPIGGPLRVGLLGLTGVATGIVLTGGGAFLAHAVARGRRFRRTLALAWLLVLACSGVLITPMLAAGLAREPLTAILDGPASRWIWSAVAVLAVELVAAGSMVAHAGNRDEQHQRQLAEQELFELASERNQLQSEIEELRGAHERERAQLLGQLAELRPELPTASSDSRAQSSGSAAKSSAAGRGTRQPASRGRNASQASAPVPCRYGCGADFSSLQAECGHLWRCPRRPAAESSLPS